MTEWELIIDNIGGFKKKTIFPLRSGLNLIIGKNATGKTSLIKGLRSLSQKNKKLLPKNKNNKKNNRVENSELYNYPNEDFLNKDLSKYLNNKARDRTVILKKIGTEKIYNNVIKGHGISLLNFIEEDGDNNNNENIKSELANDKKEENDEKKHKINRDKISNDRNEMSDIEDNKINILGNSPDILPLVYIDTENPIIEAIEYSGNLTLLKNYIMELSKIKYHQLILSKAKKLNSEYREKKEKELKELNNRRKKIQLEINSKQDILEKTEKEIKTIVIDDSVEEEYNNLIKLKEDYVEKQRNLENNIQRNLKDNLIKIKIQFEKVTKEIQNFSKQKDELEQFENLETQLKAYHAKIADFDVKIRELKDQKQEKDFQRKHLNELLNNLNQTLEKSSDNATCEYCLNKINFRTISKKVEELQIEKKTILKELNELDNQIKDLTMQQRKYEGLIRDIQSIPRKIAEANSKLNSLKKKKNDLSKKIEDLDEKIKLNETEINKLNKDIEKINKKIISISGFDEKIKKKQIQLLERVNIIKTEINKLMDKEDTLKKQILLVPEGYNQLLKRTEILITKLDTYLDNFYFEFIDLVNEKMELIIPQLEWNFRKVMVDDNLDIIIENNDGVPQDFATLSTFERKSFIILFILIFKLKYLHNYPIFAIDEHLNSADSQRLFSFLTFINELLKDNTELIIVTSLPFKNMNEVIQDLDSSKVMDLEIFYL